MENIIWSNVQKIMSFGPEFTVIKKGENGALLFYGDMIFPAPAYPLDVILDPTGAGDSFAGGFIGHIARQRKRTTDVMKEAVIWKCNGCICGPRLWGLGLSGLSKRDIQNRYKKYRAMVSFG